jgi:hypothetical protein
MRPIHGIATAAGLNTLAFYLFCDGWDFILASIGISEPTHELKVSADPLAEV